MPAAEAARIPSRTFVLLVTMFPVQSVLGSRMFSPIMICVPELDGRLKISLWTVHGVIVFDMPPNPNTMRAASPLMLVCVEPIGTTNVIDCTGPESSR